MENKFEYKVINSKFITHDDRYQRPTNLSRVAQIIREYDPNKVNPPKLSFRDGKYYAYDGKHTITVLKTRNNNEDLPILCKVTYGLTWQDEAALFEDQNGISRKVEFTDKMRSRFNRGEERETNAVRLAESIGFYVDFKKGSARNHIVAVVALAKAYDSLGPAEYANVLSIIKAAWDGESNSLRQEIIDALSIFCKNYAGQYDRAMLIRKLKGVPAIEIIRNGRMSTASGSKKYAQQIVNIYNKNMKNRLDDVR